MNISMKAINISELGEYVEKDVLPFAICVPNQGVPSKLLLPYLEKYYDKVEDRKGRICYYCNVINAFRCRNKGYESITFADGNVEKIDKLTLRKHKALRKFVVVTHLSSGKAMDSVSLVKTVRLSIEDVKKQVNGEIKKEEINKSR